MKECRYKKSGLVFIIDMSSFYKNNYNDLYAIFIKSNRQPAALRFLQMSEVKEYILY